MKRIVYIASVVLGTTLSLQSCRDSDLEPTLVQQKMTADALNTTSDMRAALNGAYDRMSSMYYYGRDFHIFGEVRSDNAYSDANSNRFVSVGQMVMNTSDGYATDTWVMIYRVINSANMVATLDLGKISGDEALKNHYLGEALVIRALAHFDLLKLYGQQHISGRGEMSALAIPYVNTLEYGVSITPARNTVQEVYDLAMADLDRAISLMSSSYDTDNHYLSRNAAYAIKARIALYFKQYAVALEAAKQVIDSGKYSVATSGAFAGTFNTDATPNQIFSIDYHSADGLPTNNLASIYLKGNYGDIVMLNDLYSKYEDGDVRASLFEEEAAGNTYRNLKYTSRDGVDDVPVIRYEEVILTYAEAALQTGDSATALTYLNMIPSNRGASSYTSATLDNILLERRKEFAGEGFRFYDLIRTGQDLPIVDADRQTYGYDAATKTKNPVQYGSYNLAFPIPLSELNANANMVQNFGY